MPTRYRSSYVRLNIGAKSDNNSNDNISNKYGINISINNKNNNNNNTKHNKKISYRSSHVRLKNQPRPISIIIIISIIAATTIGAISLMSTDNNSHGNSDRYCNINCTAIYNDSGRGSTMTTRKGCRSFRENR